MVIPTAAEDVEQLECSQLQRGVQSNVITLENIPEVSYDPVIQPLGIYPRQIQTYVNIKMCTKMFITLLFVNVKDWKQPKCPSTGELINCGAYNRILLSNKKLILTNNVM